MGLSQLAPSERDVVGGCLRAAAEGPFFEDWELHSLFGLDRAQLQAVAAQWPDVDEGDEAVRLAINNSLCNLLWYPHERGTELRGWVGVPDKEIERVFGIWRGERAE